MGRYGITTKKSLGQNFLVDQNILNKIVEAADLTPAKGALEIGPGIGALTEKLAQTAGKVLAVEIDQRLIPVLRKVLGDYSNASVQHGDILKTDLPKLWAEHFAEVGPVSVVANLPYYITTPIIMNVLESGVPFEHMVVMIQKEVADRMAADPGGKVYGSLSVAVQYYCSIETVTQVPHTVFIPQPNVESAVIRLTRRSQPAVQVKDESVFFEVVQASFAQRRKTLYNNLIHKYGKERKEALLSILEQAQIDPTRRGETLSLEEFALIADQLGSW
jgi:16S rRNA (adenine1518-N6/adenine1519-N6)-dimethyltransferase